MSNSSSFVEAEAHGALIVTGMHRSGTSLFGGLLTAAGIDMGRDLIGKGKGNRHGHYEDVDVVRFHERALLERGASTFRPPSMAVTELTPDLERSAYEIVAARSKAPRWGWKDPRTTLFLPLWARIIPHGHFVVLYRHPVEVALSLLRRGLDIEIQREPRVALQAWKTYNERVLEFRREHRERCVLLSIHGATRDLSSALDVIASRTGVALTKPMLEGTFHPADLRLGLTAVDIAWDALIPEVMELYASLESLADLAGTGDGPGMPALSRQERELAQASEHLLAAAVRVPGGGQHDRVPLDERIRYSELQRLVEQQAEALESSRRMRVEQSLVERTRAWRLVQSYWALSRDARRSGRALRSYLRRKVHLLRPLPSEQIVVGCVAENDRPFLMKARRLMQSIEWFGGALRFARRLLCVIDDISDAERRRFETLGVTVRVVERFDRRSPHSNKLQFFEPALAMDARAIMLLDCDMAVVGDPTRLLLPHVVQAAMADVPSLSRDVLVRLFTHHGVPFPAEDYETTLVPRRTILYCNSGFLFLPRPLAERFSTQWIAWNRRVLDAASVLGDSEYFVDQASLALTIASSGVPFEIAPPELNFPLHMPEVQRPSMLETCDPVILHYHDRIDDRGRMLASSARNAAEHIAALNRRIDALADE